MRDRPLENLIRDAIRRNDEKSLLVLSCEWLNTRETVSEHLLDLLQEKTGRFGSKSLFRTGGWSLETAIKSVRLLVREMNLCLPIGRLLSDDRVYLECKKHHYGSVSGVGRLSCPSPAPEMVCYSTNRPHRLLVAHPCRLPEDLEIYLELRRMLRAIWLRCCHIQQGFTFNGMHRLSYVRCPGIEQSTLDLLNQLNVSSATMVCQAGLHFDIPHAVVPWDKPSMPLTIADNQEEVSEHCLAQVWDCNPEVHPWLEQIRCVVKDKLDLSWGVFQGEHPRGVDPNRLQAHVEHILSELQHVTYLNWYFHEQEPKILRFNLSNNVSNTVCEMSMEAF